MRERWRQCEATLGGKKAIKESFDKLPTERLKAIKGSSRTAKWNRYYKRQIEKECETRDNGWLYRGWTPDITQEEGAIPNQREIKTAKLLQEYGFKVRFRKTRESESKRTSDAFFITGESGKENFIPWEFKRPHGNGKNNIYNQFNEASGQSNKLVIDASVPPFSFDDVCKKANEGLQRREDFTDVIVIKDSQMRHMKKE